MTDFGAVEEGQKRIQEVQKCKEMSSFQTHGREAFEFGDDSNACCELRTTKEILNAMSCKSQTRRFKGINRCV